MQPGFQRDGEQRVPGRMELNLIEPMAVAIERAQHRRVFIGVEAKLHRFRLTQRRTQRGQLAARPFGPLARNSLAQHNVAREQIIGLERWRLVADLEHRVSGQWRDHCTSRIRGNSATCSSPTVSGQPCIRFMFWIAWPEAPLIRLSRAEITIARPRMRSLATPMNVMFGSAHMPGLRRLAERQQMHKGLLRVEL